MLDQSETPLVFRALKVRICTCMQRIGGGGYFRTILKHGCVSLAADIRCAHCYQTAAAGPQHWYQSRLAPSMAATAEECQARARSFLTSPVRNQQAQGSKPSCDCIAAVAAAAAAMPLHCICDREGQVNSLPSLTTIVNGELAYSLERLTGTTKNPCASSNS